MMDTIKNDFLQICEIAQSENVKVELMLTGGESLKLGYQKRKLEKFEASRNQIAGFRVVDGYSQGYAFTENLSLDSLKLTFQEALKNARTLKNENNKYKIKFATPEKVQELTFLNVSQTVPIEDKLKAAEILESAALELDSKIQSTPYCGLIESKGFKRILNSDGLDVSYSSNSYSAYTYAFAKDGTLAKTEGCSDFVRDFKKLDPKKIAEKSARGALKRLPAKKLKTGDYPVIIENDAMASFLAMLAPHLSAQNVLEGKSLLNQKLNQKLASPHFQLQDDPFHEQGGSSRPFDSEGSCSQVTPLFESGVLKTFLTHLESAELLKLKNTANASRTPATSLDVSHSNLVLKKGTTSRDEMLKKYPKLVLVTQVTGGLHAGYKESTGDFSIPCEGFLYENGKLVGPVDQFVMSGNILKLLQDIEAVGADYGTPGSSYLSPDVLVKSLSFAGEA
jgi:PmbA protein